MITSYLVTLKFERDVLGTNPCDPHVLDTHILDRQRKLITERRGINKEVNKYLDQLPITKERGEEETNLLITKLETLIGREFSPEEKQAALKGELESLKETFQELDLKATTVFFWDKKTNKPCIGDHMIYGFLKAATEAIGRTLTKKAGTVMHSISYTQSLIAQHVRCKDHFISFDKDIKRNANGDPVYLQRSLRAMTAQGPRITLAKSEVIEAPASLSFTLKVMKNSPITEAILKQLFSYGEISGIGQWRNASYGAFTFELEKIG